MKKVVVNEYPVHLAEYPLRLANSSISSVLLSDEYLFATYFATILQACKIDTDAARFEWFISVMQKHCKDNFDLRMIEKMDLQDSGDRDRMMKVIDDLRTQFNEKISSSYVTDFFIGIAIFNSIKNQSRKSRKSEEEIVAALVADLVQPRLDEFVGTSSITENLARLGNLIKLNPSEKRLIEINFMLTTDVRMMIFKDFFFSLVKNTVIHERLFAVLLGAEESDHSSKLQTEISNTLSSACLPVTLHIVDYDVKQKKVGRMSQFWCFTIANYAETDEAFFERFVKQASTKKKSFSGAIARAASPKDEQLLQQLLYQSNRTEDITGLNVLLYGTERLDKIGYITQLLAGLQINTWQAQVKEVQFSDVPSVVYVAQQYLHANREKVKPAVLVISRADHALSKRFNGPSWLADMMSEESYERKTSEMDSDELILINNPFPAVWMVGTPAMITPENVGRFLFQCELKGGSRADRRKGIEEIIKDSAFSPELIPILAKYFELNTEQIKSAAKLIDILKIAKPSPEADQQLIHLIENSQRALDREATETLRDPITKYSTEFLNLNGNFPIDKIIESLKKRPISTLCFYGLPGTGKTQLAEYIAVQLDKQLIVKPASELLSKYVGESEQNIAKAFAEAQAEDAVFLLDEADSFLRDRSTAHRSWEVTQVNELLQRMERYKGTFICATNLFQSIDAAALRRFTFKLEFLALQPKQALKMLINETGIDYEKFTKTQQSEIEMELMAIKHLTPGDFATVKRQMLLLDEKLTVQEFMKRLDNEAKAKAKGIENGGFNLSQKEAVEPLIQIKQKV